MTVGGTAAQPGRIIPRLAEGLRTRVIYADPRHYAKNPDLCLLPDGRLLCTFMEGDQHVPFEYSRVMLMESADGGETWSAPRVLAEARTGIGAWGAAPDVDHEPWLSPRITRLRDGRLVIICDKDDHQHAHEGQPSGIHAWWSTDAGRTWDGPHLTGVPGIEPDKVVELDDGTLLIGTHLQVAATQKLGEFVARSRDGGRTWDPVVPVAVDAIHNYCEGAIVQLANGRLVCVMRENNHNNYPCYLAFSGDRGLTWSAPVEAPFSGDRPYAGLLSDGRFFVTHADQAGRPVTNAWAGDIEAEHGYKVAIGGRNRGRGSAMGTAPLAGQAMNVPAVEVGRNQHLVELAPEALALHNKWQTPIRYHLLPPDLPATEVEFEAELRIDGSGGAKFEVLVARVGLFLETAPGWLRLAPQRGGHAWMARREVDLTRWRTLKAVHRGGLVEVFVDGESVARFTHFREAPWERSFFGSAGDHRGTVWLRRVRYATRDAGRRHEWTWDAASGAYPNQNEIDRWLTLALNEEAFPDHGYTAWAELPAGKLIVVETTSAGAPLQKAQLHAYYLNIQAL
jgi:sialidase-1